MEIRRLEAEKFHSSGRTVRHDEANSRSTEFCNGSKNPYSVPKEDRVNRLYMDRYSAAWSVCVETDFSVCVLT
jgi:hypothetical protein